MPISSMTGFARSQGASEGQRWQWDLRSVNGKALDLRLRLPQGFEHLEAPARQMLGRTIKRGNIQASLSFEEDASSHGIVINEKALDQAMQAAQKIRKLVGGGPIQVETLLTVRGVVEPQSHGLGEDAAQSRDAAVLAGFAQAVDALASARRSEGAALEQIILGQIGTMDALIADAANNPSRKPEAVRARLAEQIERLFAATLTLDAARLHQEAMLLATRNDIQEEIDRLRSHSGAARILLASTEPVGRKFDFLAQELNREANTLCSKSADIALTNTGLELKNLIDQLREQVQNIE
jgi:uncharacterized protein (TIGR00255 family)